MPALIVVAVALLMASPAAGQTCMASFYARGRMTASGEPFRPNELTAASRTLPFNTRVRVSFRGRSVVTRITDRGPAAWTGRCLDVSVGTARAIGLVGAGVGFVTIERE